MSKKAFAALHQRLFHGLLDSIRYSSKTDLDKLLRVIRENATLDEITTAIEDNLAQLRLAQPMNTIPTASTGARSNFSATSFQPKLDTGRDVMDIRSLC